MSSPRERRIIKELNDIHADKDKSGVYAHPVDPSDLTRLRGTFPAPPDTPYAGGTFAVSIQIPDNYPFKSPIIRFETRIFHPNVSSQTGAICLDTLGSGWSPVQTIKTALLSLRMLLESPNPKDPQDAEVAKMMIEDPGLFARTAYEWSVKFAGAPVRQDIDFSGFFKPEVSSTPATVDYRGYSPALVERFVNMGFPAEAVVEAFLFVGIDTNMGRDYQLEEAYMGDITARLLRED